jgi:hypothetical protein
LLSCLDGGQYAFPGLVDLDDESALGTRRRAGVGVGFGVEAQLTTATLTTRAAASRTEHG